MISNLHGLGSKSIGIGLTFDQEVNGVTGKESVNTWYWAGFVKDQVGDVFETVFFSKRRRILRSFR